MNDNKEKLPNNENEKRERRLMIANAAALTIVFAAIALFMTFGKRPNVSYEENRNLEKPPVFTWEEYWKGNVTEQFGKYYNDTVPLRSTWKLVISEFRGHLGIKYDGGVTIVGKLPVIDEPDDPKNTSTPNAPDNSNPNIPAVVIPKPENSIPAVVIPPKPGEQNNSPNSQYGEVSGRVMVLNDGRAFLLFKDADGAAEFGAGVMNSAKEQLPDLNVYSLIPPTAVSFYLPEKYAELSDSERAYIDRSNALMKNVTAIDAYSALEAHTSEDIYFKTDHHWTQLGAYYAAEEFAEAAGVPFDELSQYERREIPNFVGKMYAMSEYDAKVKDNPETFVYYVPRGEHSAVYYDRDLQNPREHSYFYGQDELIEPTDFYLTYMNSNWEIVHISGGAQNGRKLMILKNSYGNALAPNLFNSFEDVWVVDINWNDIDLTEFAKQNGITDLLYCVSTFQYINANE
ncbi:MAG: hypothetical protein K2J77_12315 [Oscillospiraceae bacterium]|nr:hypothetical protein [Oscillospiraceae bacterium]